MSGLVKNSVKVVLNFPYKLAKCFNSTVTPPNTTLNIPDVPGLSKNIVKVPSSEVGPGASKDSNYKNPEYFSYNNTSYFEAEVEMKKYRGPQPSALKN